jgi:hypothetical protein
MKVRHVCGVLAASATLLVSGAAFSGGATTTVDELTDFDTKTGELWGYPHDLPLAAYIHSPTTQHLFADLSTFLPPDPCLPLARAWNFTADFDAREHLHSTFVFDLLLTAMSDFRCSATVTSPSSGGTVPPPIIALTPVSAK